jgi:hypothetical protein
LVTVHNCYRLYHPSCEQVQYLQIPATAETIIPNGSTVKIVISDTSRSLPDIVLFWKLKYYNKCVIKMALQEVGGGCGDWMELAQDRDRWRALVGTVRDF